MGMSVKKCCRIGGGNKAGVFGWWPSIGNSDARLVCKLAKAHRYIVLDLEHNESTSPERNLISRCALVSVSRLNERAELVSARRGNFTLRPCWCEAWRMLHSVNCDVKMSRLSV